MDQKKPGNPWSGNSAEEINMKTQKERTFSVNLPSCYTAKDVLKAVQKNVGNAEIDTVAKQSFQGYWTIITKTTQGAKILLDLEDLYMAEDEGYRLIPRIKSATLLTLPFVDPEIRNSEICDYFKMYGTVKNVAYEHYRDPEFGNVKTGRRLVFIDLYEGHGVPPFCIVRGQKISVSYRGRRPICFHCNVEGHTKAKCPIAKFKTCYNCGSPAHEHVECWELIFVAYFFKENKKYPLFCYPTDYEPEDPEDETVYGLIQNVDEARVYNLTFDPYFYSPDAAVRYRQSTYDDTEQDQETTRMKMMKVSISLEASHILKYLLVNKAGRVGLPAIEEQAQILDQENGRSQDIERLVLPKVGSKIPAYFKSLKRGQIIQQLIHDVRHILGQCKWAQ